MLFLVKLIEKYRWILGQCSLEFFFFTCLKPRIWEVEAGMLKFKVIFSYMKPCLKTPNHRVEGDYDQNTFY